MHRQFWFARSEVTVNFIFLLLNFQDVCDSCIALLTGVQCFLIIWSKQNCRCNEEAERGSAMHNLLIRELASIGTLRIRALLSLSGPLELYRKSFTPLLWEDNLYISRQIQVPPHLPCLLKTNRKGSFTTDS